ncbi:hypothetical protein XENTR_v10022265 [Xenopus tropicalis]|uniref:Olfactory receptor 11L1-like n=1 Tax=Xenopus tropicalis TaxID=8364 RepID=A0A8J0QQY0_XENTR|nr:olfactory receptor 11L1-like [Xenopus tropicalis]KAE8587998.1 hypothetical protein XENTR_v10022265 [Xenopus tropicalis]|eukprot:XP_002937818.1 PREDICTED: olfactory receptor 11L1-like [Xenopus tropicalis]
MSNQGVMAQTNTTADKDFILLAFTDLHQFQILLFLVFLLIYITCMVGNIAIILIIKMDTCLHTPMYIFISLFAASEYFFMSSTVPNLLSNLIGNTKSISFAGCFAQFYAVCTLGGTECYLLAVMAFDRDLAINFPLRYSAIMSQSLCIKLGIFPWILCLSIASLPTIFTLGMEFCGPKELNHFICDLGPLEHIACSVPFINKMIVIFTALSEIVSPFIITIVFYIHIITTILNIRSTIGKKKAFSTCSSHLMVASLFYSTAIIVYMTPQGSHEKYLALIYNVVTPLINPFIYTLRNKDVIKAFKKLKAKLS